MDKIYEIYMGTPVALPIYEIADKTRNIIGRLRFKRFECCFENAVFEEIDFGASKKRAVDYKKGTDKPVLEQVIEDVILSGHNPKIKLHSDDGKAINAGFRIVSNFRNDIHIVTLSMCYGSTSIRSALKYLVGGYTRTAYLLGMVMPDISQGGEPRKDETDSLYQELVGLFDPAKLSKRGT